MESVNNFNDCNRIIKNNLISRVESIDDATSKDKFFEYLNDNNISYEEKKLVEDKKNENKNIIIKNIIISLIICSLLSAPFTMIVSNFLESLLFILFFLISIFISYAAIIEHDEKYIRKNASPEKLKDLYIKIFKDNINDYLPLNKEELRGFYNNNEFIKAYVDKNPDEIFTLYSLNTVAGIKMNNLHMINEFKYIIDNKKMLLGLPEGQKIVVHNSIKKEQKL